VVVAAAGPVSKAVATTNVAAVIETTVLRIVISLGWPAENCTTLSWAQVEQKAYHASILNTAVFRSNGRSAGICGKDAAIRKNGAGDVLLASSEQGKASGRIEVMAGRIEVALDHANEQMPDECRLLALSRRRMAVGQCPLSGVKQTSKS
jgi:hypothetical protein